MKNLTYFYRFIFFICVFTFLGGCSSRDNNNENHDELESISAVEQDELPIQDKEQKKEPMILLQYCTTIGAIEVRFALEGYDHERRNRVRVASIAPSTYISDKICHSTIHYIPEESKGGFVLTDSEIFERYADYFRREFKMYMRLTE